MRLKLAAISKSKWNSAQFVSLREQIKVSSRKIKKKIDLGIERERLINACNTIQHVGFSDAVNVFLVEYEIDLDLNQLEKPFLEIGEYRFLEKFVINTGKDIGGFITSMDVFYGDINLSSSFTKTVSSKFPELLKLLDDDLFKKNHLIRKLKYAFSTGEPIGSSDKLDRHKKLIYSLRDFIYLDGKKYKNNPFVRFAYGDGSVGNEFYLFSLDRIDKPVSTENINIGLISNRHAELEEVIDYYLIRNFEISKGEDVFISEQEQIAYQKAFNLFELILKSSDAKTVYHVNLYHTGLEAAVIGVYRAILEILLNSRYRGKIIFKPFITLTEALPEWF